MRDLLRTNRPRRARPKRNEGPHDDEHALSLHTSAAVAHAAPRPASFRRFPRFRWPTRGRSREVVRVDVATGGVRRAARGGGVGRTRSAKRNRGGPERRQAQARPAPRAPAPPTSSGWNGRGDSRRCSRDRGRRDPGRVRERGSRPAAGRTPAPTPRMRWAGSASSWLVLAMAPACVATGRIRPAQCAVAPLCPMRISLRPVLTGRIRPAQRPVAPPRPMRISSRPVLTGRIRPAQRPVAPPRPMRISSRPVLTKNAPSTAATPYSRSETVSVLLASSTGSAASAAKTEAAPSFPNR